MPPGIDPGFDYNPGKVSQAERAGRQLAEVLGGAAPDVARSVIGQTLRSEPWRRFVDRPLPGEIQPVALVPARPDLPAPLRTAPPVATVSGDVVRRVRAGETALQPADWSVVQRTLDTGRLQARMDAQGATVTAVLTSGPAATQTVTVVELVLVDGAWALTELRQLTPVEAAADVSIVWALSPSGEAAP